MPHLFDQRPLDMQSEPDVLNLFVEQLNRIYCAKSHLAERLGDIADISNDEKFNLMIDETIRLKEYEIDKIDDLYLLLKIAYNFNYCKEQVAFLENTFSVYRNNMNQTELAGLMLLAYLYHIETVEKMALRSLYLLAEDLDISGISNHLISGFDSSDRALIDDLEERFIST